MRKENVNISKIIFTWPNQTNLTPEKEILT